MKIASRSPRFAPHRALRVRAIHSFPSLFCQFLYARKCNDLPYPRVDDYSCYKPFFDLPNHCLPGDRIIFL